MPIDKVRPGQVYEAADPRNSGMTIQVTGWPAGQPSRVEIVTLTHADSYAGSHFQAPASRGRKIACSSLHEFRLTQNETVRVTGYVLKGEK